jgi:hypothetical protein
MSSDTLAHFGCLDELIQVVYQGVYRFLVLSNVDDEKWTVHLGLSGADGRWWRGSWFEADILQIVVRARLSIIQSPTVLNATAESILMTACTGL